MLALPEPRTALVCGNDVIALGALSAARQAGRQVPADLTLIGFDDIPMSGWPMVGLTTLRCDLAGRVRISVEFLAGPLEGTEDPLAQVRLPPQLVLRDTHGPAPTT